MFPLCCGDSGVAVHLPPLSTYPIPMIHRHQFEDDALVEVVPFTITAGRTSRVSCSLLISSRRPTNQPAIQVTPVNNPPRPPVDSSLIIGSDYRQLMDLRASIHIPRAENQSEMD